MDATLAKEAKAALERYAVHHDGMGGVGWHGCALCHSGMTLEREPVKHKPDCLLVRLETEN